MEHAEAMKSRLKSERLDGLPLAVFYVVELWVGLGYA
jgi:hypothetical protein